MQYIMMLFLRFSTKLRFSAVFYSRFTNGKFRYKFVRCIKIWIVHQGKQILSHPAAQLLHGMRGRCQRNLIEFRLELSTDTIERSCGMRIRAAIHSSVSIYATSSL